MQEKLLNEFSNKGLEVNNHYLKRYIKFMLQLDVATQYGESHHILPKSIFPEFALKTIAPWNQKRISARAHFIAHWLLTKAMPGNKQMARAFWVMTTKSDSNKREYKITSKTYEFAKTQFSESMTGENHPMYGQTHTDETRAQLSKNLKKYYANHEGPLPQMVPWTEERRQSKSEDTKRQLAANDHLNTEESRKKRIEYNQKLKESGELIVCPHCGETGVFKRIMIRWHFDNCKQNPNYVAKELNLKHSASMKAVKSKKFRIVDPSGNIYESAGLKDFCKTHGLSEGMMQAVCRGNKSQHKGWTGEYLS